MKIAIADNNGRKFTDDIIKHWESQGHEVRYEPGASEHLAQWADVYYVDTWDNNIHYLWKLYNGDVDNNRTPDWDNGKKPRIIVRVLDWEVWIGWVRDQAIVDWVDDIVFIASHIQKRVASEVDMKGKDSIIRPGVNLDKFTLKQKQTDGYQIGAVLGDMWMPKNHMGLLDIFVSLYMRDKNWRLHIRGQHEPGDYWPVMFNHYLESRGIKDAVTLYPHVENMNDWYENIDFLIHPGMKEAFSYATAEGMAKGLVVFVNEFYGSEEIWPERALRYKAHEEVVYAISKHQKECKRFNHPLTRKLVEDWYPLKGMLDQFDKLLNK